MKIIFAGRKANNGSVHAGMSVGNGQSDATISTNTELGLFNWQQR